ncbi:Ribosome biogenesis GTPase A [Lentilactobacillus parabuchneri]|jgi:ribosome biogenesis GTPase A|uniref:Ribosome biogenesis GTPase A n=4 Tax=Lentilactobacillus parabuchneri TaxID=152331 RepID=A0A1X1FBU9_9LACO|nr:ribosome biogenesis GTPase YlqF [Lentilactobacillus parabuchneri]APR08535.1 Ribosome biogenesis GTPase A [Lentilactobacillus parabuchneri]KRM47805.1 ribosome biogenesis GTP-binding protein YlqF [Lentilactobacillus parabuchneri DSM 5707 = NBRC 107865]MBW0221879.1 ribosome biogenesis GTPase YlqF [Lentilactobacillus parabuchneri]MBW0244897.1 ribosome biogenesis GTPase YlqF [Lentilactobacillus parabuchneri]MBW0262975.1 ribosome biogenesis GTPase YlqF [Lentilactobacillus parabuchneri]
MAVTIQWFPGHMAKAIRQFEENLSLVDIVFEVIDARIPLTSQNPEIRRISAQKPHLYIMTKRDLADPKLTNQWLNYFAEHHQPAIAIDAKTKFGINNVISVISPILREKLQREQDKGMKKRPIRAISVGVPNVGKSTVLNRLVNRRAAQVGNRPGVTKGQQWLKSDDKLELLDTPGILWPKFSSQEVADKLALTGAIKESVFASDDVALFGLGRLRLLNPNGLKERYHLTDADFDLSDVDLLLEITKKVGMRDDYERGSNRIIQDFRSGKIGRFTLDNPEMVEDDAQTNN